MDGGDQIYGVLASNCLQSVRLVPRPPEAIVIQYASRTRDDLGGQFEMVPDADGCWANASRNMTSWFPDRQDRSAAALEVAGHA